MMPPSPHGRRACERQNSRSMYFLNEHQASGLVRKDYKYPLRHAMANKCSTSLVLPQPSSCDPSWRRDISEGHLEEIFTSRLKINDIACKPLSTDVGATSSNYHIPENARSRSSAFVLSKNECIMPTEFMAVDSTLNPWELPTLEQQLAIIQQVEYYFSDDYLSKDAYFLRQVRRKKEGYLSMKLITNFKKLRKLVNDPRITAYCLRKSKLLQVNDEGTKVRRILDVPKELKRFRSPNSVLVVGIPSHLAKITSIMTIFCKYGDMLSVQLKRSDKECPGDILENMEDGNSLIQNDAIIEFENTESAISACRFLGYSDNEYGFSRVVLIGGDSGAKWKGENEKSDTAKLPQKSATSITKQRGLERRSSSGCDHRIATPVCSNSIRKNTDVLQDKEESLSDNEWIKSVVNHVLEQTYTSSEIKNVSKGSKLDCAESCNTDCNEYMRLHANLHT